MKKSKILIILYFNLINFGIVQPQSYNEFIPTENAIQEFKEYLEKQKTKHQLPLTKKQINSLIKKGSRIIFENSEDNKISQIVFRKIKKDLKTYFKTTYADLYKPKRSKSEVFYKQARRRIRATIKDFIINKQKINDPVKVRNQWAKVRDMVYKKLDKAAYFNDFNELVVNEPVIPKIIAKSFEILQNKNHNKNSSRKRKRKSLFPEKISAEAAEKLIREMIRNQGIEAKYSDNITTTIMREFKTKFDKKGRINRTVVVNTAKQKIKTFKTLRKSILKKPTQGALDRFIEKFRKQIEAQDWGIEF